MHTATLTGIDGSNPLGFLAALGALVSLRQAGEEDARLRWKRQGAWVPEIVALSRGSREELSHALAENLKGRDIDAGAEARRRATHESFETAKKALKKNKADISRRRLRGVEHQRALQAEQTPLELALNESRQEWLDALANAVPRLELALGKRLDCTPTEFREHAARFSMEQNRAGSRGAIDLLAAFGSDACQKTRSKEIDATPFCFVTGSGQQYFLDTVRQLIQKVTPARIHHTLFDSWTYRDPKFSMRWDPLEDRRYALMARDPSDDGPTTEWMANLLAYRGLVLFPCAPTRQGLKATAWSLSDDGEPIFTWPIWCSAASSDAIRSVLQLSDLGASSPDTASLRSRGLVALYRSRRIKVGSGSNSKLNFSPAVGLL